uniref:Suppressor of IKBKE 1 n=2 Tax=Callorhinchus milii TaxID=7868 RepID=A0A4W3IN54_CALMI
RARRGTGGRRASGGPDSRYINISKSAVCVCPQQQVRSTPPPRPVTAVLSLRLDTRLTSQRIGFRFPDSTRPRSRAVNANLVVSRLASLSGDNNSSKKNNNKLVTSASGCLWDTAVRNRPQNTPSVHFKCFQLSTLRRLEDVIWPISNVRAIINSVDGLTGTEPGVGEGNRHCLSARSYFMLSKQALWNKETCPTFRPDQELNPGPLVCEANALTTELQDSTNTKAHLLFALCRMTCTIEKVLTDAKALVERLKDHDNAAESLIEQTTTLNRRVESMKEVGTGFPDRNHEDVVELNQLANHKPHAILLQENTQIRELHQENKGAADKSGADL